MSLLVFSKIIEMKVRVPAWKIIWRFLATMLGIYAFVFVVSINMFIDFSTGTFRAWDYKQILLVGSILAAGLGIFIPSLINAYYKIENTSFSVKRLSKEYVYTYSNIEFIDFELSEKKKKVIFYIKGGKMQYLLADKDNVLMETLKKKCKNLKNKEEFLIAHPEER